MKLRVCTNLPLNNWALVISIQLMLFLLSLKCKVDSLIIKIIFCLFIKSCYLLQSVTTSIVDNVTVLL